MCELLIMQEDKINPDNAILDAQCMKRGEVIVIMPDGHKWGEGDLGCGIVVKLPGVSVEKAEQEFMVEMEGDIKNEAVHQRSVRFDLDAYELTRKEALTEEEAKNLKRSISKPGKRQ